MCAWSGEWDPDELAGRITPELMDKWEVFNEVEPIGMEQIHRLLAIQIMNIAANSQVDLKLHEICPWLSPDP